MSNPLGKKNPFMSLWLSQANRMMGKSRPAVQAAIRRQHSAVGAEAAKAVIAFWGGVFSAPAVAKRRKSRR